MEKISFHKKRALFHQDRASEWDRILSQIQALQRQEQPKGRGDNAQAEGPEPEGPQHTVPKAKVKQLSAKQKQARDKIKAGKKARKKAREEARCQIARQALQHAKDGILPVDVRRLTNERGLSTPSNFPYKLFTSLVQSGRARKDDVSGRYYPIGGDEAK